MQNNLWLNRVLCGDAQITLKELPSASVNCIVTSPPYYRQRDYSTSVANWKRIQSI